MNAVTQLALNAITSLRRYWGKQDPDAALAALRNIRDMAEQAIDELGEAERDRLAAEAMASEGAHIHPDYVERLR